jgi:hypothetical protein
MPTMGSTESKNVKHDNFQTNSNARDRSNKVCIDCQRDKQVAYPGIGPESDTNTDDKQSTNGNPCFELYNKVDICMKGNQGQITSCVNEWKLFNDCFTQHKDEQRRSLS